ncbi:META domain-containing protein [Mesonia sp.]|uniref:META domain-containing protein n=1 Tax=Mesonia sp. TaxID=1960830 RepID=UPI00175EDF23|nr:META domain-containing protein [Mesonia sp.]HIB38029.1 META domain-containing protein [Mesonia sp.]
MKLKFFILCFAAFSLIGCKDAENNSTKALETAEYSVEKVGEMSVKDFQLTMNIDLKEKLINGFAGCNSYSGGLNNPEAQQLKVMQVVSTRKMCQEAMQAENGFLEALRQTTAYQFSEEKLQFTNENGKVLIEAKKK